MKNVFLILFYFWAEVSVAQSWDKILPNKYNGTSFNSIIERKDKSILLSGIKWRNPLSPIQTFLIFDSNNEKVKTHETESSFDVFNAHKLNDKSFFIFSSYDKNKAEERNIQNKISFYSIEGNLINEAFWNQEGSESFFSIKLAESKEYLNFLFQDIHKYSMLIQTDKNGQIANSQYYLPQLPKGDNRYFTTKMCANLEGELYVTGYTLFMKSEQDVSSPSKKNILCKLSPEGKLIWTKIFEEGTTNHFTFISPTFDGGVILGGLHTNTKEEQVQMLLEYDKNGNIVWNKELPIGSIYHLSTTKNSIQILYKHFFDKSYSCHSYDNITKKESVKKVDFLQEKVIDLSTVTLSENNEYYLILGVISKEILVFRNDTKEIKSYYFTKIKNPFYKESDIKPQQSD
jgi:hypothetical protein